MSQTKSKIIPVWNTEVCICECGSADHQFIFRYSNDQDDYPEVYMTIHLTNKTFWKRFLYAWKYLLGRQCKYGAFDEVIINPDDAPKLEKIVEYLTKVHESNNTKRN